MADKRAEQEVTEDAILVEVRGMLKDMARYADTHKRTEPSVSGKLEIFLSDPCVVSALFRLAADLHR